MTPRELAIAVPILAFAILLGVYPQFVFRYMTPSVNQTVDDLAAWTERAEPAATATALSPPVENAVSRAAPKVASHRSPVGPFTSNKQPTP